MAKKNQQKKTAKKETPKTFVKNNVVPSAELMEPDFNRKQKELAEKKRKEEIAKKAKEKKQSKKK